MPPRIEIEVHDDRPPVWQWLKALVLAAGSAVGSAESGESPSDSPLEPNRRWRVVVRDGADDGLVYVGDWHYVFHEAEQDRDALNERLWRLGSDEFMAALRS